MSGIAELLANLGYAVSGSDAKRVGHDRSAGVARHPRRVGHDAAHVGDADVVVDLVGGAADEPGGRRGGARGRSR